MMRGSLLSVHAPGPAVTSSNKVGIIRNFARHILVHPMIQPRQAHLCRQPAQPRQPAGRRAPCLRAGRHPVTAPGRWPAGAVPAACHRQLCGRIACGSLHPRPRGLHPDQRGRHFPGFEGPQGTTGKRWMLQKRSISLPAREHRRGVRHPGTRCARFTDPKNCEPNSPYSASKAASDHPVRAWHHPMACRSHDQLQQQLRAVPLPGKAHPADDRQRPGGQTLPVYGDGMQIRDWLYVKDHCSAIRRVLEAGAGRNPTTSAAGTKAQHRHRQHGLRLLDELRPRADGPELPQPDHLREGPPRPRPALCHRRPQDRARAGLETRRDLRHRHPQDRAVVPGPPRLVAQVQSGAYRDWTAKAIRGRAGVANPHEHPAASEKAARSAGSCSAAWRCWARSRRWTIDSPTTAATCQPRGRCDTVRQMRPRRHRQRAAHTAVDKAEANQNWPAPAQRHHPGVLAEEAAAWRLAGALQHRLRVSTAAAPPGSKPTRPPPVGVWPDQAGRRATIQQSGAAFDFCAPAGSMPRGGKLCQDHAALAASANASPSSTTRWGAPTGPTCSPTSRPTPSATCQQARRTRPVPLGGGRNHLA